VGSFSYPEADKKNLLSELRQKGEATTHAIFFAFNAAELKSESKLVLHAVAEYLQENPAVRMTIEGHTDSIGGTQFNLELSRNRAESVKKYLVQQTGVSADRLTASGLGFAKPVADNATPEGRALNRRVVFREVHRVPGQLTK
jgi:OmpA-OmpF porin, OOP family